MSSTSCFNFILSDIFLTLSSRFLKSKAVRWTSFSIGLRSCLIVSNSVSWLYRLSSLIISLIEFCYLSKCSLSKSRFFWALAWSINRWCLLFLSSCPLAKISFSSLSTMFSASSCKLLYLLTES